MSSGSRRRKPHTAGVPPCSEEDSVEGVGDSATERLDQHRPLSASTGGLQQHAIHAADHQSAARTHKRTRNSPPASNDDGTSSAHASSSPKRHTAPASAKPRSSHHRHREPPSPAAESVPPTQHTDRRYAGGEESLANPRQQPSSAFRPPLPPLVSMSHPPTGEGIASHINLLLLNHYAAAAATSAPSPLASSIVPNQNLYYSHPAVSQALGAAFSLPSAVHPSSMFDRMDYGLAAAAAAAPMPHPVFSGLNLAVLDPPAPSTAMIDPRLAAAALLLHNQHQQHQWLAPAPPPNVGSTPASSEPNPYAAAALAAALQSPLLAGLLTAASGVAGGNGPPQLLQPSSTVRPTFSQSSNVGIAGLPHVGSFAVEAVPPPSARRLPPVLSADPSGHNGASVAAATTSSSSTPSRAPTGRRPVSLYLESDVESLSAHQCFVRQQIELFEALPSDVESNAQGRNRPIVLGQVGIRCRHCAMDLPKQRARGAVYYPSKLNGLYQAAQNLALAHLADKCPRVPHRVRDALAQCRDSHKSSAGGGKLYWAEGVRALGVYEDSDGLRFEATSAMATTATTNDDPRTEGGGTAAALRR